MIHQNYRTISAIRPIVAVCALLFLFLPMFQIKCANPFGGYTDLASIKGTDFVWGGSAKVNNQTLTQAKKAEKAFDFTSEDDKATTNEKEKKGTKQSKGKVKAHYMIVAFAVITVLAIAISFYVPWRKNLYLGIAHVIASLCVGLFPFVLNKAFFKGSMDSTNNMAVKNFTINPLTGFYLVLIFSVVAAALSFLLYNWDLHVKKEKEKFHNFLDEIHIDTTIDNISKR